jgi:hypothetical protein
VGIQEPDVLKVLSAKSQVRYEQKLDVASKAIPESLKPGGVNALSQLYVHISGGLQGESDDACVESFEDRRADFEYVFSQIYKETRDRCEYAERLKNRQNRK